MNLSELKALIVDDNVYKTIDIKRALEYSGIKNIITARNQEDGFELIYQSRRTKAPIGLIVTDMRYPLASGMDEDREAGFKLIERLNAERLNIPVIICSTSNIKEPSILGTVWYSALSDLNQDFQKILERL